MAVKKYKPTSAGRRQMATSSFEEITRTARLLVERYGVESIRLTGGEPTIRANLPGLVQMLSELPVDLSMTTN